MDQIQTRYLLAVSGFTLNNLMTSLLFPVDMWKRRGKCSVDLMKYSLWRTVRYFLDCGMIFTLSVKLTISRRAGPANKTRMRVNLSTMRWWDIWVVKVVWMWIGKTCSNSPNFESLLIALFRGSSPLYAWVPYSWCLHETNINIKRTQVRRKQEYRLFGHVLSSE